MIGMLGRLVQYSLWVALGLLVLGVILFVFVRILRLLGYGLVKLDRTLDGLSPEGIQAWLLSHNCALDVSPRLGSVTLRLFHDLPCPPPEFKATGQDALVVVVRAARDWERDTGIRPQA